MNKSTTKLSEKQIAPTLKQMRVNDSELFPKKRTSVVRATIGRLQVDLERQWKSTLSGEYIIVTRLA